MCCTAMSGLLIFWYPATIPSSSSTLNRLAPMRNRFWTMKWLKWRSCSQRLGKSETKASRYGDYSIFLPGLALVYLSNQRYFTPVLLFPVLSRSPLWAKHVAAPCSLSSMDHAATDTYTATAISKFTYNSQKASLMPVILMPSSY